MSNTFGTSGRDRLRGLVTGAMAVALLGASGRLHLGLAQETADGASVSCLQDADATPPPAALPGAPAVEASPFPRVLHDSGNQTVEQLSRYHVVHFNGGEIRDAEQLKAAYPDVFVLRYFSARAYQGDRTSMPFSGTASATAGEQFYAGHWLYLAGTRTEEALAAGSGTVQVVGPGRLVAGDYAVIYDAPFGSFANAEHVKVLSTDVASGVVTFETRGYKSTAVAHAAGSIIATHAVGAGGLGVAPPRENWGYNQSMSCPGDGNGKRFFEVMAQWLGANLNADPGTGEQLDVFDGVLFDGDVHSLVDDDVPYDVNNDGVPDLGVVGSNVWGVGLEALYAGVQSVLTPKLVVGGAVSSWGFSSLNGTQMEAFPNNSRVLYEEVDEKLAAYADHLHHNQVGPVYTEAFNKSPLTPSLFGAAATNGAFRFALGTALLEDGYFGTKFGDWWDEYAVDVAPGSPTYGFAVAPNPADESRIRRHRGWLGRPLGSRIRLYDVDAFQPSRSLLANGGFEAGIPGWTGENVSLDPESRPRNVFRGSGSLHVSKQIAPDPYATATRVTGPAVRLTAGFQYTICFAARSSKLREVGILLGPNLQSFFTRTAWTRRLMTLTATASGLYPLTILLGGDNTEVWLDEISVFPANADVFRRDFERGIVIVNATYRPRRVDLGDVFQRILGTQDPINDGRSLSTVKIGPHDAAILVRPSP